MARLPDTFDITWFQILIAAWSVCSLLCFLKAWTILREPHDVNNGDNDSPPVA